MIKKIGSLIALTIFSLLSVMLFFLVSFHGYTVTKMAYNDYLDREKRIKKWDDYKPTPYLGEAVKASELAGQAEVLAKLIEIKK